jgi:soluble lytic murein transglycosylase-like protein
MLLLVTAAVSLAAAPAKAPPPSPEARFKPEAVAFAARYRIAPALAHEIIRAARDEHMPVHIAFRLVRRESGFRVRAVGRAGEIGLTQIKPATARLLVRRITAAALYHPGVNLHLGFRYAVAITRRHHGDWYRGLAGYHIGSHKAAADSLPSHGLEYASSILIGTRRSNASRVSTP